MSKKIDISRIIILFVFVESPTSTNLENDYGFIMNGKYENDTLEE